MTADNVFKLLDSKEEENYSGTSIDQNKMNDFKGSISFQNITFKYHLEKNMCFKISI